MLDFLTSTLLALALGITLNLQAYESTVDRFGTRADSIVTGLDTIAEPTLSHTKKAFVTENKFGFDTLSADINWIIEDFLASITPGMIVMDVGAGYGKLTRLALDKGATVISNEISENQQLYTLKFIKSNQKKRLYFHRQDIRTTSLPNSSLDAIMFHRVLHFFKGKEIENILTKTYQWLKPGGKIYIVMMSKDHVAFRDKIYYDDSKRWPGEGLVIVKKHIPDQAYALPSTLHVVSVETLEKALVNAGFLVEKLDYISMKKFGGESNRDGKEAVGAIAVKREYPS